MSFVERIVVNTGIWISAALRPTSVPAQAVTLVTVTSVVTDSPDPKDNPFLALALDAGASLLLASDPHLYQLHPWRGIHILNAATFVAALDAKL